MKKQYKLLIVLIILISIIVLLIIVQRFYFSDSQQKNISKTVDAPKSEVLPKSKRLSGIAKLESIKLAMIDANNTNDKGIVFKNKTNLIGVLLEVNGIDQRITDIPTSYNKIFETLDKSDPNVAQIISIMVETLENTFTPEKMREQLNLNIEKNFTTEELIELIDIYQSPVMQKGIILEEQISTPEKQAELERIISNKVKTDISEERLNKIRNFVSKSEQCELLSETLVSSQLALVYGLSNILPKQQVEYYKSTKAIATLKETMRINAEKMLPITYGLTFQQFSDTELDEYLSKSLNLKLIKFQQLSSQTLSTLMQDFGRELGSAINQQIGKQ